MHFNLEKNALPSLRSLLVAAVFALAVLCGCTSGTAASSSGSSSDDEPLSVSDTSYSGPVNEDGAAPDSKRLASLIGESDTVKLLSKANENEDLYWIAAHPGKLKADGKDMQVKLLKLAINEEEAVKFVRDYPDRYPEDAVGSEDADAGKSDASSDSASSDDSSSASSSADSAASNGSTGSFPKVEIGNKKTPHLYQWDQRWGYTVYSSAAFALAGCGPTALAMAYQGVTGNSDRSPYDMGVLAQEAGYMAESEGTDGALFVDMARDLGMYCEELVWGEESLQSAFNDGCVVIANVGNGYFSQYGGHYLVLTGFTDKGKLVMNDPYSAVNSHRPWDVDFVLNETTALYAFWKLPEGASRESSNEDYVESYDESYVEPYNEYYDGYYGEYYGD